MSGWLVGLAVSSILTPTWAGEEHLRQWPEWRGPLGNGVVPHGNPPLTWSEQQNVKWKVPIPGSGHATPAIWGDRLFVLTSVPTGERSAAAGTAAPAAPPTVATPPAGRGRGGRPGGGGGGGQPTEPYAYTVLCLDRATGQILWERVVRQEPPHQTVQPSNSYSSASPLTDGRHVYASFGSHGLYCLDFDGRVVWEKDLGKVNVTFGEGSSPALFGETLVVVQDNNGASFIYAFDKRTGAERWKQPRDEGSGWTTPTVLQHNGAHQVIVNGSNAVRSYDFETGRLLWQCSGLGSNPVPMIVSDGQTVYAMSGHRDPAAIAIQLGRSGDLTDTDAVRWRINRGTPYVPSPLLVGDLLFFSQHTAATVTCVDPATGEPYYAGQRLEGLSGIYASPIAVNDRIYLAGRNGITLVLALSKELEVLATNRLDEGIDASPAVVGNELFIRSHHHLYCLAE